MQNLSARLSFEGIHSFRVVDERHLLEYWPECSSQNGWIFKVVSGSFYEQEKLREGNCIMSHFFPNAFEILVTGLDDCVSITTQELPSIEWTVS